ncbi:hypothetical protein K6V71_09945 [Cupriavidus gilardii]|uniref:hypothetical protein n=1 Tax=Cupriavidus gilardii TaxID=82541 RepID=UPI0021B2A6EE|nr:hypothetical protein [Cupriavidus gilardii]UXC34708.1 hypothetical protein N4G38_09615 [Cupriavidus gilardii]
MPLEPASVLVPDPAATWTAVRKDFVEPGTRCAGAGIGMPAGNKDHGIGSGHAYILRDAAGREHAFGPDCALRLLGGHGALDAVPDFTARAAGAGPWRDDVWPRRGGGRQRGRDGERELARQHAAAVRYLLLRMDKVAGVPRVQPSVRFAPLEPLYAAWREHGKLTQQQASRVLAIERSPSTPATLKTANLLDVYTAYVQLERALREAVRLEQQRFLRGVMDWLARHLTLTRAQGEAAGLALHPRAWQLEAPPRLAAAARDADWDG